MRHSLCLSLVLLAGPLLAQYTVTLEKPKPTPYEVEGLVVDSKGQPIEGAGVAWGPRDVVTSQDARDNPVARTDTGGRLTTRLVAEPGKPCVALLSAPGKISVMLRLSGSTVEEGGEKVRKVELGTVVLRDGVDIRGAVRTDKGKPLPGARVTASDVFTTVLHIRNQRSSHAIPTAYATSDEKGRFVLAGVPKRGVTVVITAKGHYSWERKFVSRHTPLVAELPPGGMTSGQVVDAKGNPVKGARISVYYEHQERTSSQTAEEEGKFEFNLSAPGRYRLRYYARFDGAARYTYRWSKTFDGPQENIRLQFDEEGDEVPDQPSRPAAARGAVAKVKRAARAGMEEGKEGKGKGKGIRVKVTDASGKQIKEFKAVIGWLNPTSWQHNPGYLERQFQSSGKKSDASGELVLPPPGVGRPGNGRILVKAKGFAPKVVEDVEWDADEDDSTRDFTVELAPGTALAGVVVDSETGKPVPGVKVFVTDNPSVIRSYSPPPLRMARADLPGHVVTDQDGRFHVETLGDGNYHVYASHANRPDADPITVKLALGKDKKDVRIEMHKGAAILGKLTGAKLQLGWQVRVSRMQDDHNDRFNRVIYGGDPNRSTELVSVDRDGRFTIKGLSKANYMLSLVMPYDGDTVEVPIEPVRLRSRDLTREFDVSEDMPGRLSGRVKMKGAALPPGRLLLLARRLGGRQTRFYSSRPNFVGSKATVSPAGKFDLPLREGRYYLSLVDLASAVTIYQREEPIKVSATKTSNVDLTAELAMVQVKLVAETEGKPIVANRLEIRVEHPPVGVDPRMRGVVFGGNNDRDRGIGISIPRGETEIMLFLPPVETKLLVRSSAHNLDPSRHSSNFPAQGEEELTPELGKMNKVEIRVAEPDIDAEAEGR